MTKRSISRRFSGGRLAYFSFLLFIFVINIGSSFSEEQPLRILHIKIAVASELKIKEKREILNLIRDCSRIFKNHFSIQFKVKENEDWKPEKDQNSIIELLSDLRMKVLPGECDIILGIVPQRNVNDTACGIFSYFHGYILIKYIRSKETMKLALLHELSHIFGAVDLKEPGSVMDNQNPGFKFDDFSKKIILLNRNRSFYLDLFPLSKSQLDKAISLFRERTEKCAGESEVHRFLAFLYLEEQKYSLAEKECLETLELKPGNKEIHNILGGIYLKKGEIDLALDKYKELLDHFPNLPEIHLNLGLAYLKKGIVDKAESRFKRAIELNPRYPMAHALLGRVYIRERKIEQAIMECQMALKSRPENADFLCTLAAALILRCDDIKREAASIKKLGVNCKSNSDASQDDKILKVEKLLKEAEAKCLKALEVNPDLAEANNTLGITYIYQGEKDKAEAEFLKALELNPNFVQAHHNLGLLYFNYNKLEKAAMHLKRIIDINFSSGLGFQILEETFKRPERYYISLDTFK